MARDGRATTERPGPGRAGSAAVEYRGRFAPSPSGELHFGSLVAAVGSFLDARAAGGRWRVRIEDLDPPRERPGAADAILRTLEILHLHWDGDVVRQSTRGDAYEQALARLEAAGRLRPCRCSRSALAALAENRNRPAGEELFHPGHCLPDAGDPAPGSALRLRVRPGPVDFVDRVQGPGRLDVAATGGDFVLRRRDGLYAYQLAVVIDDAWQEITHVVRGADLLTSTPRQRLLQEALGLPTPAYLHLPLAVDDRGRKLSKSADAPAAARGAPGAVLANVLEFLRQPPPPELSGAGAAEVLGWAVAHWRPEAFAGVLAQPVTARKDTAESRNGNP